jgi:hypothetical protein
MGQTECIGGFPSGHEFPKGVSLPRPPQRRAEAVNLPSPSAEEGQCTLVFDPSQAKK